MAHQIIEDVAVKANAHQTPGTTAETLQEART